MNETVRTCCLWALKGRLGESPVALADEESQCARSWLARADELCEVQIPKWLEKSVWESFEAGGVACCKAVEARRLCKRSKYAHAILLRYLVTLPEDEPVRKTYLAHAADWKWSEDGHPWELIAFYRAILLGRTHADYTRWLRRGYDLAKTGGPTLQLIACVIAAGLLAEGVLGADEYNAVVEQVLESLPALDEMRLATLRTQASSVIPPMEYAKKVLPFNFR